MNNPVDRSKQSKAIDESARESFPASDPPASHLPDEPPVNADAKWAAAKAAEAAEAKSGLDPAFIDEQRTRLIALRDQILGGRRRLQVEQKDVNAETDEATEAEEDAQRLMALELQENLEIAADDRLSDIERALQKIDDGTYGLSDATGTPIPIERLRAAPESRFTIEEQRARPAAR